MNLQFARTHIFKGSISSIGIIPTADKNQTLNHCKKQLTTTNKNSNMLGTRL